MYFLIFLFLLGIDSSAYPRTVSLCPLYTQCGPSSIPGLGRGRMCEKFHQLLAVGRWFPLGTLVSSTRKLISSSFHHLDMPLAVAEGLTPNEPVCPTHGFSVSHARFQFLPCHIYFLLPFNLDSLKILLLYNKITINTSFHSSVHVSLLNWIIHVCSFMFI